MKNALINGDSLDILKKFPDNSFDSMITDPPAGIAFMGKKWDKDKGGRDQWIAWLESIMTEAFRTLKPGAHILVWAIPRTSHWTATAIENSGFDIKDVVTHIFGSGFPKNHNIGKAIDREQGVKREVVGKVSTAIGTALPSKEGPGPGGNKPATKNRFSGNVLGGAITDEAKQWEGWGTALKPASEHWILARKPVSEKTIAANVLEHGTGGINIDASRIVFRSETDKSEAKPQGRATTKVGDIGAKPDAGRSLERVEYKNEQSSQGRFPANLILSHKPGCRQVGTQEGKGYTINRFTDGAKPFGDGAGHPYEVEDQGLEEIAVWDCDDDCAIKEVNNQSGIIKGVVRKPTGKAVYPTEGNSVEWNANNVKDTTVRGFDDTGGAARFFKQVEWDCEDDCAIKTLDDQSGERKTTWVSSTHANNRSGEFLGKVGHPGEQGYNDTGGASRFYKNFEWECEDDCAIKALNEQSGVTTSGKVKEDKASYDGESSTKFLRGVSTSQNQHGDTGGASRFFKQVEPENTGRFPANLVLSHKSDCKQVGTKKIKASTQGHGKSRPYESETTWNVSETKDNLKNRWYADADGNETVSEWDCAEDCAVKQLDEQSIAGGMHAAGKKRKSGESKQSGEGGLLGVGNHEGNGVRFGDNGGASRFFYCAKASKKEKTLNKTIDNKHPTVKSLKLMKYLINLVTPPGGVVLDPFMGSGTTGQAALEDDFGFVGIELETDSFEICKNRCSIDNIIISPKIELDD